MDGVSSPDGGWGYACVVGTFQSQMLFGLAVRTFGVLYLLTLDKFQTTATVVSWIGATNLLSWGVFSTVASVLCNRYSCRVVAGVGSVVQCVGFLISAFASHIAVLYVGFGLFVGCGVACTATAGYLIVSIYFRKKRARYTAIASSGSSFAVFCMPPLVNFLAEYYGFQGCLIILSGIALQGLVSASLFRPLKRTSNSTQKKAQTLELESKKDRSGAISNNKETSVGYIERDKFIEKIVNEDETHDTVSVHDNPSQVKCRESITKDDNHDENMTKDPDKEAHQSWLQEKFQILRDEPVVAGFILVNMTVAVLSSIINSFTAALAKEQGYKQSVAVLLISIGGITDIIARIFLGFILDSSYIRHRRMWVYCGCGLISSVACLVLPLVPHFAWYSVWIVVHSSVVGTIFGQRTTMIADLVGMKRIAPIFGMVQMINAFGLTAGVGIGGVLRDQLGTYDVCYFLGGSINFIGFLILLVMYKKLRSRNGFSAS